MKTKIVIFILIVLSILFFYNIENINSPITTDILDSNDNGFSLIEDSSSKDDNTKPETTAPTTEEVKNTKVTDTTLSNSGMSKLTSTGMGR